MNKLFLWIAALSAFALQSCQKDDGIQDEIDSLRDRIAALELKVGEVNTGIQALHKLMSENRVIVGVESTKDGEGYELKFSDGSSCPVYNAEKIEGVVTPVMGIDDEGFWTISFDGGTTSIRLKSNGEWISAWPVAGGEHEENAIGITPEVRVTTDGYWEVNYGKGWEPLEQDGKPVNAVGDNVGYSSCFNSVSYDEKNQQLIVELLTNKGEFLTFPVFDNFDLTIKGAENALFFLGKPLQFEVEQENVAAVTIEPLEGWSATLEETTLMITPPAEAQGTEETAAFTLSIIATSEEGYLKLISMELTLVNKEWDANACEAWQNFKARNSESSKNVLLDFSYAGYKHGEVAPPDVWGLGYTVYDVTKYGLDPTGQTSSRAAFVALLKELRLYRENSSDKDNPTANAIIYFPEGKYILHDEDDNKVKDGTTISEAIVIQGGNFIIKGAGRDKTELIMDAENWPENPDNMWSSPMMINIKHNSGTTSIATVAKNADAESHSIEVSWSGATRVKAGDWVLLKLEDNNPELVAQELAPYSVEGEMTDIQTIHIEDYHQVKSVSGNTVEFYEPLFYDVDPKWNWTLHQYKYYENVGVEDLTFVGHAKEKFSHHADWRDDGAYKPLNMMRLTNSWIRRVDFKSVSEAVSIVSSANCSAYDIRISGNRGHSAVRSQGSSRVFIGKVVDESSGYQCNASNGIIDNFMDNAGQYHASGVSNPALGTVLWNNTWGDDALFESHSKQPRATLVDCGTGGFVQWRFGGDKNNVPNHLRDLTIWNMNATRVNHDFGSDIFKWWNSDNIYWKTLPPIIVGFHGGYVNFGLTDGDGKQQVEYLESNGTAVEPLSLYEAQLYERLGYVPGWLNSLK